jgi:hypothetical protein
MPEFLRLIALHGLKELRDKAMDADAKWEKAMLAEKVAKDQLDAKKAALKAKLEAHAEK